MPLGNVGNLVLNPSLELLELLLLLLLLSSLLMLRFYAAVELLGLLDCPGLLECDVIHLETVKIGFSLLYIYIVCPAARIRIRLDYAAAGRARPGRQRTCVGLGKFSTFCRAFKFIADVDARALRD